MPADEVHRATDAATSRARTGPRHAAPKKPLLTRLQMPAGKAIALAAMPTAVLMGMGLTPQLAQAKPGVPKNPFRDGPCVTAPDEQSKATEEAEKDAKDKAAQKAEEKAEAARKRADEAKKKADDAKDSSDADDSKSSEGSKDSRDSKDAKDSRDDGKSGSKPSGDSGEGSGKDSDKDANRDSSRDTDNDSSKAPAPAETRNPLDPLGVGDAIKDILTPKEKAEKESESARSGASKSDDDSGDDASDSENSKDSENSESSKGKVTDKATKPVEDTLGKVKDGLEDTEDTEEKAIDKAEEAAEKAEKAEKAAEKAKDEADPDSENSEDSEDAKDQDPMAPDEDGKKPFPCVVEKKVDGDDEQAPAPIPNQPWHLEASSLTLKGADYKGVVNLKMPDGRTKQALKYIISGGTDIGDLHQIVEGPGGRKYHVEAAKGSMSTIRNGDTTMYTERISGNLFGLIPITFDPEHPPPLNLPLIYFTNVKVQQAGQFGGDLTIPGLHQSITD
ncbi:hypothetical protein [Streptomyces silvensis]|uniref:Hydrogenase expression protein HypF n=1 Tax=Streptomyces silvensis TaxID=1765722 RepID=A0A0W7WZQ1_9ACTN|nr:hypothetical protein [Streptomyces silvensis]KUF16030.1 hypothetical protein AT728_16780 [Streptomyces silvensis]